VGAGLRPAPYRGIRSLFTGSAVPVEKPHIPARGLKLLHRPAGFSPNELETLSFFNAILSTSDLTRDRSRTRHIHVPCVQVNDYEKTSRHPY
jgi:hypothetical protein